MTYDGGKNGEGTWQKLINLMPPHRVFIEAFFGSGALTRRKRPAEVNVGIELDPLVVESLAESAVGVERFTLLEGDALLLLPVFSLLLPITGAAAQDVLVYADPPYLGSTRGPKNIYRREMKSAEDHSRLLDVLDALPCLVMLSGYWSELYARRLTPPKWRVEKFTAGTRGGPREECVWLNFPVPQALHDYRWLGRDYVDRQRIRRKIERRVRLLRDTPALERAAIVSALRGV